MKSSRDPERPSSLDAQFGETWIQREIARRLDALTEDPRRLTSFDANDDGVLDDAEWEVVRSIVTAEVVNEARDRRRRHGLSSPDDTSEIPVATLEELNPARPDEDDEDITGEWSLDDLVEVDEAVQEEIAGRYTILRELGRGSQGKTYLGRDLDGTRFVAIKELSFARLEDWKALDLFRREAKLLETLDHLGIPRFVEAFHIDTDEGPRFFLVQQYLDGDNLAVRLKRGERFDEARARRVARGVLEILIYLQSNVPPIVHRDIKPANILERPGGLFALVDFGTVSETVSLETGGSTVVGTTGYMPPEQLMGRANPSSDLYALGVTLVHLVTRRHPTNLPVSRMRLDWHAFTSVSPGFREFVDRLIAPSTEDRPQSAAEAKRLLEEGVTPRNMMVPVHKPPGALELASRRPQGTFISIEASPGRVLMRFPHRSTADVVYLAAACGAGLGAYLVAVLLTGGPLWALAGALLPLVGITFLAMALNPSSELILDKKWGWKIARHAYGTRRAKGGELAGTRLVEGEGKERGKLFLEAEGKRRVVAEQLRPDERAWVMGIVRAFYEAE